MPSGAALDRGTSAGLPIDSDRSQWPVGPFPLRVLLWSPKGSSTRFYGGPPIASFRLYRSRDPSLLRVTLVHGSARQPAHPEVFDEQHQVFPVRHRAADRDAGPEGGGLAHLVRKVVFIRRAQAWIAANAGRFDVFHGMGVHSETLMPALQAQRAGLPTVLTTVIEGELIHGSRIATLTGIHRRRLAALRQATALVAISKTIRRRLEDLGVAPERIVDLPVCGVDTEAFQPLADVAAKPSLRRALELSDRPTCLFAGAIVPRKRPHLLIGALAALTAAGVDAQVVLAGPAQDPAYAEVMRREADACGVADRLIWYGFTERVADLMRAADVLALPSSDEGLPGVVMEAMACGIPCIYTDISGARDLIDDGIDGRIIAADGAGLGPALAAFLDGSEAARAAGQRARAKAEARFSNRAVLTRYLRVFENVRAGQLPTVG